MGMCAISGGYAKTHSLFPFLHTTMRLLQHLHRMRWFHTATWRSFSGDGGPCVLCIERSFPPAPASLFLSIISCERENTFLLTTHKGWRKTAYSARVVHELFSTAMSQPYHIGITEALKPHHTPFHDMLACVVRLAWSAASLRDYSLLYIV